MFIAVLFKIIKRWKQSSCPLMDEWINKMWYIHTIKYSSALKMKKNSNILQHRWILKQYVKWNNTITENNVCKIFPIKGFRGVKFIESRIMITRGFMKRRMGSYCSMGLEFPFRIIRVLQMDSEDSHPTVLICFISLSCTLKHD